MCIRGCQPNYPLLVIIPKVMFVEQCALNQTKMKIYCPIGHYGVAGIRSFESIQASSTHDSI